MAKIGSAADKAYSRLLRQIISGKRKAGEKLPEEALCKEFDVSRTPLREALLRLTREGLVERQPRYGCFVREFSQREIVELFECRKILESAALELAFDHITEKELGVVQKALDAAASGEQARNASINADALMHDMIAEVCPNRQVAAIVRDAQRRTAPFRSYRTYNAEDVSPITDERQEIVTAIREGRKEDARRLLEEHIMQGACLPE